MSRYLARLDAALRRLGSAVTLRRVYGTAPSQTNADVSLRAVVRSPTDRELAAGIAQTTSVVILSPTEIAAAGWPGAEPPSPTAPIPSLPRRNDKLIVDGRVRNIEHVDPIRVADELVRIELKVAG